MEDGIAVGCLENLDLFIDDRTETLIRSEMYLASGVSIRTGVLTMFRFAVVTSRQQTLLKFKVHRHGVVHTNRLTVLHTRVPLRHGLHHADSLFVK